MATIIAGRFEQQDATQKALEALVAAGFDRSRISAFFVNAPGKHDLYPVGGDEGASPGAQNATLGAVGGAAGAAVVGGAVGALLGPGGAAAGAAVGAYVGSFEGAMASTEDHAVAGESRGRAKRALEERQAGMMLSVETPNSASEAKALLVLRDAGATDIELGHGHIVDGDWTDFDPLSPMSRV
jgi:hypothetical protein